MNYESKESRWYPVTIYIRDINGKRQVLTIPDISFVCEFIENHINPDVTTGEEEILMVYVDGTCIYSALGNDPITWDDIKGFFA